MMDIWAFCMQLQRLRERLTPVIRMAADAAAAPASHMQQPAPEVTGGRRVASVGSVAGSKTLETLYVGYS